MAVMIRAHFDGKVLIQALMELWVVATRPANVNGLGLTPSQAADEIAKFRRAFAVLPDPTDLLQRWLDLCTTHSVSGRPAHDARLVAVMLANNVTRLFTLNPDDFKRYPEIACLGPSDL